MSKLSLIEVFIFFRLYAHNCIMDLCCIDLYYGAHSTVELFLWQFYTVFCTRSIASRWKVPFKVPYWGTIWWQAEYLWPFRDCAMFCRTEIVVYMNLWGSATVLLITMTLIIITRNIECSLLSRTVIWQRLFKEFSSMRTMDGSRIYIV